MALLREMLRAETRGHHDRLTMAMRLTDPGLTRSGYLELLQGMYGFIEPIEATIQWHPEWHLPELQIEARRKTPWLVQDLLALGMEPDQVRSLPLCAFTPELDHFDELLGCLYVLEGSTLGGQFLSRHFQQHLSLDAEHGGAYFWGYGARTQEMWDRFVAVLNLLAVNEQGGRVDPKRVTQAALETFQAFEDWMAPPSPGDA